MEKELKLTQADLQDILHGERFVEEDGKKVLGIGLTSLFLFKDGRTHEKRAAVRKCIEEFLELARPHLHWQTIDKREVDLSKQEPVDLEVSERNYTEEHTWSAIYSSGSDPFDASAFQAAFLCRASWQPVGVSYLSIQLPLSYLNPDFIGRFHRFASILRATQAYAGVGILQRPSIGSAAPYETLVYELAQRYPGLEVFSPSCTFESLSLKDAMRCINWLTAVGDEFLQSLGKVEDICRGMSQQILVYRYEGGIVFQAGPKPDLGDGEKKIVSQYYREVARALKPVRLQKMMYRFQEGTHGEPNFDLEDTLRWLARFD
jgi:hypothetical protein